ncbi:MAG: glycine--tRNA ligase subunit beta, partial [Pseudomonadota bacterium]
DPAERAETIRHDAEQLAFAQGLEVVEDRGLLAEIAGLVEWPVVLMGPIEDRFLELPPEVLRTSMKEHQKFLSVREPATGRIVKWITVANRETADQGAVILAGNAKVLAARLSDALFFWENDLRTVEREGLEGMAAPLANVTFHSKLGSQADRVARIEALARALAPAVGAKPDLAAEAARLCKADLASEMVYEFPELQGTMGKYYAAKAGHDDGVPEACEEHYSPLGPTDDVPSGPIAAAVALADKLDMLAGFWAIDEKPTGSKDPFALRRAALGVIRVVLENRIRLSLAGNLLVALAPNLGRVLGEQASATLHDAAKNLKDSGYDALASSVAKAAISALEELEQESGGKALDLGLQITGDLLAFFADRLKQHLRAEGVRHDVVESCFRLPGQDDLVLLVARVRALQAFLDTEDGDALLAGYKRAANILTAEERKDSEKHGVEIAYEFDPDPKLAESATEKALFAALDGADSSLQTALAAEDFPAAMAALAALRSPVDGFFEHVTVNAENDILRRNRLCLLHRIRALTLQVADLSALEG